MVRSPRIRTFVAATFACGLSLFALTGSGLAQQPAPAEGVAPAPAETPPAVVPPPPAEAAAPTAPAPTEKAAAAVQHAAPGEKAAAPAAPTPPAPVENAPPPQPIPTTPPDPNGNFPSLRTGSSHDPPPTDVATSPLPPFEGETGHAPAAQHGAAGHHGPLISNWWSWSHGPGTPYEHPPFGFALINFAIFIAILARVFGKSFVDFLRNRHHEVRRAIDRAREVQQNAEKHLRQLEERSRNLEAEIAELLANYRRLAESERAAIVQRAEAEAQSLLKDAEAQAQAAVAQAKRELEKQTALLAVDLAEKLVKSRITDDDQKRLSEQYLRELEGMSRNARPAASQTSPASKGTPS